jgi:hypothetical protein
MENRTVDLDLMQIARVSLDLHVLCKISTHSFQSLFVELLKYHSPTKLCPFGEFSVFSANFENCDILRKEQIYLVIVWPF